MKMITNVLQDTLKWFEIAKPFPSEKDISTQMGAHFEEVAEMMEALNVSPEILDKVNLLSKDFYSSNSISELSNGNTANLKEDWKVELFDSLVDQIVTNVGLCRMLGFDVIGGLGEVNRSNYSKFVDGKPIFNEFGKIMKGPDYFPPNLTPFFGEDNLYFEITDEVDEVVTVNIN